MMNRINAIQNLNEYGGKIQAGFDPGQEDRYYISESISLLNRLPIPERSGAVECLTQHGQVLYREWFDKLAQP